MRKCKGDRKMKLDHLIAERANKKIYRDGDLCIKVFDGSFLKEIVLNEALNLARIEQTGILVPKLHEVTTVDGCWAIVSDYIEGQTLDELMKKEPDKKSQYLERLVDVQLDVQSHTSPMLVQLKDKMHAKISATALDATTRYELHTRLESMPTHKKICHGDFNPSNVIITPNDEAYVIDWNHVTQGNAPADAARTYLIFCLNGDITGAKQYLDLFCRKSDTARQYVQQWMPIVAASQSVKGNEKEREFLLSWVNVVDYS